MSQETTTEELSQLLTNNNIQFKSYHAQQYSLCIGNDMNEIGTKTIILILNEQNNWDVYYKIWNDIIDDHVVDHEIISHNDIMYRYDTYIKKFNNFMN
jgi:hypothetical protein